VAIKTAKHTIQFSEEDGVRFLHFGNHWVQGAMRIARPNALELEYTRDMMAALLLTQAKGAKTIWPKTILQVGLGAASITKFLHRNYPETQQTIVEINPSVVAMAKHAFKLPTAENIQIKISDAAAYIETCEDKFDIIFIDGFDAHARAGALEHSPFYAQCLARLNPNGILSVNLFSRGRGIGTAHQALAHECEKIGGMVLAGNSLEGGNTATFALPTAFKINAKTLQKRVDALYDETGLKLHHMVGVLAEQMSDAL
jgi:spermidine synthase